MILSCFVLSCLVLSSLQMSVWLKTCKPNSGDMQFHECACIRLCLESRTMLGHNFHSLRTILMSCTVFKIVVFKICLEGASIQEPAAPDHSKWPVTDQKFQTLTFLKVSLKMASAIYCHYTLTVNSTTFWRTNSIDICLMRDTSHTNASANAMHTLVHSSWLSPHAPCSTYPACNRRTT